MDSCYGKFILHVITLLFLTLLTITPSAFAQSQGPWNIEIDGYSSASDKVELKRIETELYTQVDGLSTGTIKGEITNSTNYDIYGVSIRISLKDSTGSIREQTEGNAWGEDIIIAQGAAQPAIKPGKSGFFEVRFYSDELGADDVINAKRYSVSVTFLQQVQELLGDIDRDGDVDFDDFFILADNFGKTVAAPSAKPVLTAK